MAVTWKKLAYDADLLVISVALEELEWQQPVEDKDLLAPPGGESKGDRYLIASAADVELDYMEYANDAAAQAAYLSSDPDVVDQNFESGADAFAAIGNSGGNHQANAWRFTTGATIICNAASIYIEGKNGVPSGDITFRVETSVGDLPSGALVHANATGVIANASVSLGAWNKCSLTPFSLAAGTYWVVIKSDDQDPDVYWKWSRDADGTGRIAHSNNNGVDWTGYDNAHMLYTRVYAACFQCYSESSIKQQGSYSLKGIAKQTDSLNETLTRTIGAPIDLSGIDTIKFDIYALRTGAHIKIGIHDSGGTTTEKTHTVVDSNTWEEVTWDISGVADVNKDDIDSIIITISTADADNIFYIDNMYAVGDAGAWGGHAEDIAQYNGSGWDFITKKEGMVTYVKDEQKIYIYITSWQLSSMI